MKFRLQLFTFLLLTLPAFATNYYVAQSGSATCTTSSSGSPMSVATYNTCTQPTGGDTVFFTGTITSQVTPNSGGTGTGTGNLTLDTSGATVPVPFISEGKSHITLNGGTVNPAATSGTIITFSGGPTDVTIQNFTYSGSSTTSTVDFVINSSGALSNITIQSNTLTNVGHCVNFFQNQIITNITIQNNHCDLTQATGSVNDFDNIQIAAGVNVLIQGNFLRNNSPGAASGHQDVIQTYCPNSCSGSANPSKWTIRYNWIARGESSGSGGNMSWDEMEGLIGSTAATTNCSGATWAVKYYANVFVGGTATWAGGNGVDLNSDEPHQSASDQICFFNNTLYLHADPINPLRGNTGPGTFYFRNNAMGADASGCLSSGDCPGITYTAGATWDRNFMYNWNGNCNSTYSGPNGACFTSAQAWFNSPSTNDFSASTASLLLNKGDSTIGSEYSSGICAGATWPNPALCARSNGNWDAGAYQHETSVVITAPTVTTTAASLVTSTTAQSGGTVTNTGGATITAQGVAYSTSGTPTSPCTGSGTSSPFTTSLTSLSANTQYFYRACATNSAGTGYGATLTFTTAAAAGPVQCPAPAYSCFNASLATITNGATPNIGNLTGAGTTFVDPEFGAVEWRGTDADFGSTIANLYNVAAGSGSGDEMHWSLNDDRYIVGSGGGNYPVVVSYGSASTPMYVGGALPHGFYSGGPLFFGHNANTPYRMYAMSNGLVGNGSNRGPLVGYFDVTNPSGSAPTFTQLFDFTSDLNTAVGGTFGGVTYSAPGESDQTDTDFGEGFAGGIDWQANHAYTTATVLDPSVGGGGFLFQPTANCTSGGTEPATWNHTIGGTTSDGSCTWTTFSGGQASIGACYVGIYRQGSGGRILNVCNGQITGDWGPTGAASTTPCTGGRLHNTKIYKAGGTQGAIVFVLDGGTGCPVNGNYVWFYTTNTVTAQCTTQCSGHWTEGINTWANGAGTSTAYWASRPNTSPGTVTSLTPNLPASGLPVGVDSHMGWNFLDDTYPFGLTTYNTTPHTVNGGWQDEVQFVQNHSANPIRVAHTYNTDESPFFSVQIGVGSISQSGNYYAYTSDWQGTLGSISGTSTCNPAATSTTDPTACRGDVIFVQLNAPTTASTPVLSPTAGSYPGPLTVTATDTSPGTIMCWSGASPKTNRVSGCPPGSTLVTGGIVLTTSGTVCVVAGGGGFIDSAEACTTYTINQQASTPVFSPTGGTFATSVSVSISTAVGSQIWYNTTGSPSCGSGTLYSTPITVSSTETLYAIACGTGYTPSPVGSASFTIVSPSAYSAIISGQATVSGTVVIQ